MRVIYLLMFLCCVAGYSDKEAEEEAKRKRIIDQLTRTRTVLLDNYHLVSRQIATNVYMYRNYRTVSVLFYNVMRDVSDALFTFQTEELQLNNIGSCKPQEVIVNIKHGSYPAVNPDGYSFPKQFIDPSTREPIHTLEFLSDGSNTTYYMKNPKPGNWYAIVYVKWQDPRTQNIEQQGLVADCRTILYTDLQIKKSEDVKVIDCSVGLSVDYFDLPASYKCMVNDTTYPVDINLTITDYNEPYQTEVSFKVKPLSLPSKDNNILYCAFNPKTKNTQKITFSPHPNSWHYIHLDYVVANVSNIADCESYTLRTYSDDTDNFTILDLMRDDKGRFFTFDYGLPTSDLQDTTSLVNLTSNEIKTLRFKVNPFLDIGGSFSIEASLLMSLKYYMGYKRELNKGALLAFTEDNQYFRVVICMDIGHASVPLESGMCKYNDRVEPALFVLNSTDSETIYDNIIIPYPESGLWYLSFKLFCDEVVCPCPTSHNGSKYYVESELKQGKEIDEKSIVITNHTTGRSVCNATVVLSITSTSCVSGRCSNHGNCLLNTFGGHVMSFCSCLTGYGGWDCSDDSRLDSRGLMLGATLLLTISNLLFFLSIYVALVRLYYTEATMYAFTMVFSTFYHACDAPIQVSYCIASGNILQFGDFYCGLMSFWVTLLAMAIINERLRSFFQLIGAIIIALLATWNMHSFLAFLLPVAVGIAVMLISWYVNYRNNRKMYYDKAYYSIYLPIGVVLVSVGLICYAFLQTEQNYKWVHSVWHMVIAFSVVFLLPDAKRTDGVNPFLPSSNYCKLPFRLRRQERIARD